MGNYSQLKNSKGLLDYQREYCEETGLDFDELLSEPYTRTVDDDGVQVVNNPVAYYKNRIDVKYNTCGMGYLVVQLLEDCIIIFPILLVIMGAWTAVYDYRAKTFMVRVVSEGRLKLNLAKQLTGFGIAIGGFIISVIPAIIASAVTQAKAENFYKEAGFSNAAPLDTTGSIPIMIGAVLLFGIFTFE